jgi:P pilus assembly chaperone PapD
MCACELKKRSESATKLKLARKIPNQLKLRNIKIKQQKTKKEIQTHLHSQSRIKLFYKPHAGIGKLKQ